MSYFKGTDEHKQYREKVQTYGKEEKRLLEEVRHVMILDTEKFVIRVQKQLLPDIPHHDLRQQKQLAKDINIDEVLKKIYGNPSVRCFRGAPSHGEQASSHRKNSVARIGMGKLILGRMEEHI